MQLMYLTAFMLATLAAAHVSLQGPHASDTATPSAPDTTHPGALPLAVAAGMPVVAARRKAPERLAAVDITAAKTTTVLLMCIQVRFSSPAPSQLRLPLYCSLLYTQLQALGSTGSTHPWGSVNTSPTASVKNWGLPISSVCCASITLDLLLFVDSHPHYHAHAENPGTARVSMRSSTTVTTTEASTPARSRCRSTSFYAA